MAARALPLGPDPDLWTVAAWALSHEPPSVPPLFPRLYAALAPGRGGAAAVVTLNTCCAAAAVALAGLAAGWVPTTPAGRVGAAAGAALLAWQLSPLHHLWWVGPEAITRASLALVALASAALTAPAAQHRLGRWLLLGLAAGLTAHAREHGLVVLGAACVAAVVVPRSWHRGLALVAVLAGVQLVTVALEGPGPAWAPAGALHGTLVKASVALGDSQALAAGTAAPSLTGDEVLGSAVPTSVADLARQLGATLATWAGAGALAGVAGAAAIGWTRWRAALLLLVPLAPLAAGVAVHIEPRHVEVLTAAAAVPACVAVAALARTVPWAALLAPSGLALALGVATFAPRDQALQNTLRLLDSVAREQPERIQLGEALRATAGPGDLVYDDRELVALLAGVPRAWPRPGELAAPLASPDHRYRLWWVSAQAPSDDWEALHTARSLALWRLPTPAGATRRCLQGNVTRTPWLHRHRFRPAPVARPWSDCPSAQ